MTINEYQKAAMRTANPGVCDQLPNVALGLCGESGEIADMVKKAEYQGHELDKEHIAKELGDVGERLIIQSYRILKRRLSSLSMRLIIWRLMSLKMKIPL